MYVKSLNDARYTMWATVIPRYTDTDAVAASGQAGSYEMVSDPDSGEIKTIWVPTGQALQPGYKPTDQNPAGNFDTPCYARGYTDLGYRSSSATENYKNADYQVVLTIQFDYPADVILTRSSLITNIRPGQEMIDYFWMDEDSGNPIVFEVQGVTPVHDPFGKLLRNTAVLKRAETQ